MFKNVPSEMLIFGRAGPTLNNVLSGIHILDLAFPIFRNTFQSKNKLWTWHDTLCTLRSPLCNWHTGSCRCPLACDAKTAQALAQELGAWAFMSSWSGWPCWHCFCGMGSTMAWNGYW